MTETNDCLQIPYIEIKYNSNKILSLMNIFQFKIF